MMCPTCEVVGLQGLILVGQTLQLGDGFEFVLVLQLSALTQNAALGTRLIASKPSLV